MSEHNQRSGLLARWSRFAVQHSRLVLAVWLGIVLMFGAVWRFNHGEFVSNFEIPGAQSQQAIDLLQERFPQRAGDGAMVVIQAPSGLVDPNVKSTVEALATDLSNVPSVVTVVPPYAPGANAISPDGSVGFIYVQFAEQADNVPQASIDRLYELRSQYSRDGLRVELGGQVITAAERTPPGTSEILGLAAAIIILLFAFGSLVAMGLPLATAISGLLISFFMIGLLALFIDFNPETRAFTAMIGIGVGIDYALFIVTRYREGLKQGLSVGDAVVQSIDTAGRSIIFAGSIVVVALLGLMTMGVPFVGALGIAAAIVVAIAVLVALTVLPALLTLVGHRIDKWRIGTANSGADGDHRSVWYRLAERSQRHPWRVALTGVVLLLLLTVPALDMRIGSSDAGNNPTSSTSRQAYDLLAEAFGPGFNGPLTVAVDLSSANDPATLDRLTEQLRSVPGVARVAPPVTNPANDTAIVTVIPSTSPQSEQTQNLVHTLRRDTIPQALADSNVRAYVGGPTAAFIDIGDRISSRLPAFFAVVIGLSMILLLMVFRSLLVPIQAAIMNLLSIGAAYGVLVAVFQWGWVSGIFGVDRTGPIESFLPMMLFAVLFGLSTDYEVFLMSRIHETWLKTGDSRLAVSRGSAATSRVITAAAAIMVVVFLSFTLSDTRIVKEFGLGLATAVFLDATVIRLLLVPAITGLLGRANWYLPAWLDRRIPRLSVDVADSSQAGGVPIAATAD